MTARSIPIFVYGTLSFPDIFSALLGRDVAGQTARISGYRRIRVKDKVYPGLVASAKSEINGVFHTDITPDELKLIDAFEDDFYKRIDALVTTGNGRKYSAGTYIIPAHNLSFTTTEIWNRDEFYRNHGRDYLGMVAKYRTNFLAGRQSESQVF